MSTRAFIGIERKDKKIEGVYNHSDGYPSYLGNLLLKHYTNKEDNDKTRQMVEMILSLGDISFLEKSLQNSIFYNTWRKEDTHSREYKDFNEFKTMVSDSWYEYIYIWSELDNKWYYISVPYDTEIKNTDFKELKYTRTENEKIHCSECNHSIEEGYQVIDNGKVLFYCSDTCLQKNYTSKEIIEKTKNNEIEYKVGEDLYE